MGLGMGLVGSSVGSGTCNHPDHGGEIPMTGTLAGGGTETVTANGLPCGQTGKSIVIGECGHTGVLVGGGSSTVIGEGLGVSTVGATFTGYFSGTIISGSDDVLVGGV
jgi:hypothetical protein